MISSAVANRYASALADVVTSPNSDVKPGEALQQLQSMDAALRDSGELRNALASPAVPSARKCAVIQRVADTLGLSRTVRNFLFVLSDRHRSASLAEVTHAFEIELDRRLGFVRADVESAQELSSARKDQLATELGHLTGKQVRMRFQVQPELIGGVIARIGSTVYDGSVRGQLASIGRRLLK